MDLQALNYNLQQKLQHGYRIQITADTQLQSKNLIYPGFLTLDGLWKSDSEMVLILGAN